jgi:hypothetical protein
MWRAPILQKTLEKIAFRLIDDYTSPRETAEFIRMIIEDCKAVRPTRNFQKIGETKILGITGKRIQKDYFYYKTARVLDDVNRPTAQIFELGLIPALKDTIDSENITAQIPSKMMTIEAKRRFNIFQADQVKLLHQMHHYIAAVTTGN